MALPWTEERFERLKQMEADGFSAGKMATELCVTRNAVIGKLHRTGIWKSNEKKQNGGAVMFSIKARREAKERKERDAKKAAKLIAKAATARDVDTTERVDLPPEPISKKLVSLFDIGHGQCRWPIGEVGAPDFGFCGDPALFDERRECHGPYCSRHHAMAHAPRGIR